ncbi:TadE/TadG family type IV pilus assembly protein [Sphingomonas edaphi]|uniref:TadE/TadG family type IV pilus assembly protein n=1 Tax=Sphingomonas edaphi TaxID=2315689 RepID=UPI00131432FF|nr:TadE family protein [Sphingomonas edaphi]
MATIELALLAPMLAVLTIGVVDISNAFGRKLALEQATQRAVEKVMQTTVDDTVESVIKAEAAAQAGISEDNVTVTYQLECNQVVQSDYEASCPSGQKEARYLMVTATDRYTPMFSLHFSAINADGTYHLTATSGLRTQ